MSKHFLLFTVVLFALLCIFQNVAAQGGDVIRPGETVIRDVQHGAMSAALYVLVPEEHVYAEVVIRMRPQAGHANFDPDLYVKKGSHPTSKSDSDYSDLTIEDEHIVVIRTGLVAGDKYYMAAYGYSQAPGKVEFSVEVNTCLYNCNGRGECQATPDATKFECKCKPGFQQDPHCLMETKDAEVNREYTGALLREQITHYKVQTPAAPKDGFIRVKIRRTSTRGDGTTNIYINKNAPPTTELYQEVAFLYGFAREAVLNIDARAYSAGTWYIGVFAPKTGTVEYGITIEYFNCPRNCSNHGECNAETSECKCQQEYSLLPDCSIRSRTLEFAQPQTISLDPTESIFFNVEVTQGIFEINAEIGFQLKALEVDPEKPPRGIGWPTLYLNYGKEIPSASTYMVTSPRPGAWNQTLYIPDSKVYKGSYTLSIVNTGYSSFEYELTSHVRPHCPYGCENNGHCDTRGECKCKQNFIGGSCDISQSKCDKIAGVHKGLSAFVLLMLTIIFASLAAAISIFIYTKFWYVESAHQAPELQYDPLNE